MSECPETGYTCHIISERDRLKAEVARLTAELECTQVVARELTAKWRGGPDPLEFHPHSGERGAAVALRAVADQLDAAFAAAATLNPKESPCQNSKE